ncbi:microsomal glutathione S-transferase 1-like [Pristis pectinata]|uniref:microsomal glutathione S-transferase 1-like n=1 Tax=Pristis pectinata TaxID=685728 RepID=UPI00223D9697|nr:microsomal glutathione S-transferase 1-like [Pristis pectinata]XP_051890074.1 microsomal glutathione S-transferase 1-like [Pristis pectinata]
MSEFIKSEVFLAFSTYASIVLLKMMMMGPLTAYFRITRGAFSNPEDAKAHGGKDEDTRKKLLRTDPDVERVRRCHQNDLENIIPFIGIGLLYTFTGPDLSTALLHFRIFIGARIFHSIAYLTPLPQPSRGLSWMLGMGVTFSMAYRVLRAGMHL